MGKYEKCIEFFEKFKCVTLKLLGEEDLALADVYANLSIAYYDFGDTLKSEEYGAKRRAVLEYACRQT